MNNVLELKGKRFVQAAKSVNGGGPAMNSKVVITSQHCQRLISKLNQIHEFWLHENQPFNGILISVYYNKIVAKTNRISGIFKGDQSNYAIVGAKFNSEKTRHIITYYLFNEDLEKSTDFLHKTKDILSCFFEEGITKTIFDNNFIIDKINFKKYGLTKTLFKQIIADISYIDNFEVEKPRFAI